MQGRFLAAILVLAGAPILAAAQAVPHRTEFQVNDCTAGAQHDPSVATGPSGDFVVVWQGEACSGSYRILARRFDGRGRPLDPAGFLVNESHAFTWPPFGSASVASSDAGDFVITWAGYDGSYTGIAARRFDRAGAPLGGEFRVNADTAGFQLSPAAAMDPAGNFVIVWSAPDGDGPGIFGRSFDASVNSLASDFRINDVTTGAQRFPAVAMSASGAFVVVWDSSREGELATMGRRFDLAGNPLDPTDFQVNESAVTRPFVYRVPAVAMEPDGGFAVVWESDDDGGDGTGIFGRRFDHLGTSLAGDFRVNTYTTDSESFPDVSVDGEGNIAIAWQSLDAGGSLLDVHARRYDGAGEPLDAAEFQVNTYTTESQAAAAVAFGGDGTLVIVWESEDQDGDESGIFGQRFCDGDMDGDGLCDVYDIVITAPADGGVLDCTSPATIRPRITWRKGRFDRFRAMIAWDPSFAKETRVTSGKDLIKRAAWTPSRFKWRRACNRAAPYLYVRIFGVNDHAGRPMPHRRTRSQTLQMDILK